MRFLTIKHLIRYFEKCWNATLLSCAPKNAPCLPDLQTKATYLRIRDILDDLELRHRFDKEDHCFIGEIDEDEEFSKKLTVYIIPKANRITTQCFVMDNEIDNVKLTSVLLFCNKWNTEKLYPKAYIAPYHNLLIAESTMMLDERSSNEFIRDAIVLSMLSATLKFFVEMNNQQAFSIQYT